jgi:hypothetical protein
MERKIRDGEMRPYLVGPKAAIRRTHEDLETETHPLSPVLYGIKKKKEKKRKEKREKGKQEGRQADLHRTLANTRKKTEIPPANNRRQLDFNFLVCYNGLAPVAQRGSL